MIAILVATALKSRHKSRSISMNKPKAILFDLGDTIIQYSDFNPSRGNKELLKYYKNNNSEFSTIAICVDEC